MSQTEPEKLVVGISSRALFNLQESNDIFVKQGVEAYSQHQIAHENETLQPGVAFPLVKKLLAQNSSGSLRPAVEVVLLSRNNADIGVRIFASIQQHGLKITRAAFTTGESPHRYAQSFGVHLFLSAYSEDVRKALEEGVAAATIVDSEAGDSDSNQLRIAFDGDAVLFSDEPERVYRNEGIEAFHSSEQILARVPLRGGPFEKFFRALVRIQQRSPEKGAGIRTALITARSAPAHERVIRTFRDWGVRIDEALFVGSQEKGEFVKAFGADIFFDDQRRHVESASEHVPSAHVPAGIANE